MPFGPVIAGLFFLSLCIRDWRITEAKKAKEVEEKKSKDKRNGDHGRRSYDK